MIKVKYFVLMAFVLMNIGLFAQNLETKTHTLAIVKPDAVAAPIELLELAREKINVPVVAIGGITAENGAQLVEAGADLLIIAADLASLKSDWSNKLSSFRDMIEKKS